jgi:hypothetical protein
LYPSDAAIMLAARVPMLDSTCEPASAVISSVPGLDDSAGFAGSAGSTVSAPP